jgi:hypothetical protein
MSDRRRFLQAAAMLGLLPNADFLAAQGSSGTTAALNDLLALAQTCMAANGVVTLAQWNQMAADVAQLTSTGSGPMTVVWVDDTVPAGATQAADGGDSWTWITSNPTPYSGTRAHQSSWNAGEHQHKFQGATAVMIPPAGSTLFAYAYLDPINTPTEVMLQWNDGSSWDHRAYWGANQITWPSTNGVMAPESPAHHYVGALPATGQWVQLAVPAAAVNLEGRTVSGMAFTLYNGRATWDYAGYQT